MIFSISGFSMPSARELQQQAVGQVEGADARRVEGAHERERRLDVGVVLVAGGADLLARDAEVAVLVDVADEVGRDLADARRARPTSRAARSRCSGRPGGRVRMFSSGNSSLLLVLARVVRRSRGSPRSRSRSRSRRTSRAPSRRALARRRRARRPPRPPGSAPALGRAPARPLPPGSSRIGFSTISWVRTSCELELRHLQQLDRLLQRRRHHQPLRESEVEFLFEGHGVAAAAPQSSRKPSPR